MRSHWHARGPRVRPTSPVTHPYVTAARDIARELDDRAAARIDRGFIRSHPDLEHTFFHVGPRPTPRRG